MKKLRDVLRSILISPELAVALLPFFALGAFPHVFDILIKPMKDGVGFGLGAIAVPLGMLAFCYKEGSDILAPTGGKKILLEWPDYAMLKNRIIISFAWCVIGGLSAAFAVAMVALDLSPRLGVSILVSGMLAAAVATGTIGLARISIREIVGE